MVKNVSFAFLLPIIISPRLSSLLYSLPLCFCPPVRRWGGHSSLHFPSSLNILPQLMHIKSNCSDLNTILWSLWLLIQNFRPHIRGGTHFCVPFRIPKFTSFWVLHTTLLSSPFHLVTWSYYFSLSPLSSYLTPTQGLYSPSKPLHLLSTTNYCQGSLKPQINGNIIEYF